MVQLAQRDTPSTSWPDRRVVARRWPPLGPEERESGCRRLSKERVSTSFGAWCSGRRVDQPTSATRATKAERKRAVRRSNGSKSRSSGRRRRRFGRRRGRRRGRCPGLRQVRCQRRAGQRYGNQRNQQAVEELQPAPGGNGRRSRHHGSHQAEALARLWGGGGGSVQETQGRGRQPGREP